MKALAGLIILVLVCLFLFAPLVVDFFNQLINSPIAKALGG